MSNLKKAILQSELAITELAKKDISTREQLAQWLYEYAIEKEPSKPPDFVPYKQRSDFDEIISAPLGTAQRDLVQAYKELRDTGMPYDPLSRAMNIRKEPPLQGGFDTQGRFTPRTTYDAILGPVSHGVMEPRAAAEAKLRRKKLLTPEALTEAASSQGSPRRAAKFTPRGVLSEAQRNSLQAELRKARIAPESKADKINESPIMQYIDALSAGGGVEVADVVEEIMDRPLTDAERKKLIIAGGYH